MKFGKYLKEQIIPAWSSKYIDYRGLKKVIKRIGNAYAKSEIHYILEEEADDDEKEAQVARKREALLKPVQTLQDLKLNVILGERTTTRPQTPSRDSSDFVIQETTMSPKVKNSSSNIDQNNSHNNNNSSKLFQNVNNLSPQHTYIHTNIHTLR